MAEPPSLLERGKERHAAAMIARDGCPVAKYQPPTVSAFGLGHRSEQPHCLLVCEREQREFFASVYRGDDPRRPTAEPSTARIQENRALKLISEYDGLGVLQHTAPPFALRDADGD